MIRHIVLIRFSPAMSKAGIADRWAELRQIEGNVPGQIVLTEGRSNSPEQFRPGQMHGFVADLSDWQALRSDQDHPLHKALGARLVANALGGLDDIPVFDLVVPDGAACGPGLRFRVADRAAPLQLSGHLHQ